MISASTNLPKASPVILGVAEPLLVQSSFTLGAFKALTSSSEEHTSELQSLMCILYAVFCLHKTNERHHSMMKLRVNHMRQTLAMGHNEEAVPLRKKQIEH